tara:strand:- start:292 stop:1461 length:1170 start_codon:yes stop_codon:yes gene_type:complete
MKKINILIDYPVQEGKYTGQTFPNIIYKELKKDPKFNVFLPEKNARKDLDAMMVFAGGNHYSIKKSKLNNLAYKEVFSKFLKKFDFFFLKLGNLLSLYKLGFYKKLLIANKSYEKWFINNIKSNKNLKIIHRLDGVYQIICKNYAVDKTVKRINSFADLTIHQSNYSISVWEEKIKTIFGKNVRLKSKKKIIIQNGVNTNVFSPRGKKIKLAGKWKILHVSASSNPNKNLSSLLEAAEILKDNKNFKFYLIGNQVNDPICGSDIKYFKNCKYLGSMIDIKKLASYYRSCDILFFPSIDDCSPNVILEAMASGLPVIASNSGGSPELIIKKGLKGGVIFNKKNPILSIKTIIENYPKFKKDSIKIIKKYHDSKEAAKMYKKEILKLFNSK